MSVHPGSTGHINIYRHSEGLLSWCGTQHRLGSDSSAFWPSTFLLLMLWALRGLKLTASHGRKPAQRIVVFAVSALTNMGDMINNNYFIITLVCVSYCSDTKITLMCLRLLACKLFVEVRFQRL